MKLLKKILHCSVEKKKEYIATHAAEGWKRPLSKLDSANFLSKDQTVFVFMKRFTDDWVSITLCLLWWRSLYCLQSSFYLYWKLHHDDWRPRWGGDHHIEVPLEFVRVERGGMYF